MDMSAYQTRYVALEVTYLGERYHGLASQANTELTIEVRQAAMQHCLQALQASALPVSLSPSRTAGMGSSPACLCRLSVTPSCLMTSVISLGCAMHWLHDAPQGQLFQALRTNRLIPADASWQDIRYSRCGRTDKGVSGLGQVGCCALAQVSHCDLPTTLPADGRVRFDCLCAGHACKSCTALRRTCAGDRNMRSILSYRCIELVP
jgi:hypothetical protein